VLSLFLSLLVCSQKKTSASAAVAAPEEEVPKIVEDKVRTLNPSFLSQHLSFFLSFFPPLTTDHSHTPHPFVPHPLAAGGVKAEENDVETTAASLVKRALAAGVALAGKA
jgi:hypothetical protein